MCLLCVCIISNAIPGYSILMKWYTYSIMQYENTMKWNIILMIMTNINDVYSVLLLLVMRNTYQWLSIIIISNDQWPIQY